MKIVICKGPPSLHAILAVMLAFFIFLFAWEYRSDRKFQARWDSKWGQMHQEHKAKYQELERRIKLGMERWAELKVRQEELEENIEERMDELEDEVEGKLNDMAYDIEKIKAELGIEDPEQPLSSVDMHLGK